MSAIRPDAVTRRYAGALFELARKRGALDEVRRDVERIAAELRSPAVEAYLFDTRVELAERRKKLEPVLSGMSQLTRDFVSLLFDKRREEVLRLLGAAFHELQLAWEQAAEGVVESPAPLRADDVAKLAGALTRLLGKSVKLENRVVPELIAGVRVIADNRMIDHSARGRLDGLRGKLLAAPLPSASGA